MSFSSAVPTRPSSSVNRQPAHFPISSIRQGTQTYKAPVLNQDTLPSTQFMQQHYDQTQTQTSRERPITAGYRKSNAQPHTEEKESVTLHQFNRASLQISTSSTSTSDNLVQPSSPVLKPGHRSTPSRIILGRIEVANDSAHSSIEEGLICLFQNLRKSIPVVYAKSKDWHEAQLLAQVTKRLIKAASMLLCTAK